MYEFLKSDREIYDVLQLETERQQNKLELIASENFVSPAVLEAAGSVLTNKYAEGYPGKRYYGGCEFVDMAENLARERLKKLFGAEYVNVQPHSGSQANMAVFMTLMNPGDKFLGLSLAHGGHLTHGSPVNFSGKLYQAVSYELNKETRLLDYNIIEDLAKKEKPKMTVLIPKKGKAVGAGVVIGPGGGYGHLAIKHEGYEVAEWLNSIGVAGFVLKYRHRGTGYGHPAPLVVTRLRDAGAKVLRTDVQGGVIISTDGEQLRIRR